MQNLKPLIQIRNLSKFFGDFNALKSVDFELFEGEVIGVIGPSGSGKSTFIRCLNWLEEFQAEYLFEEQEVDALKVNLNQFRQNFGMVFQNFNLFPHMSVIENIIVAPMHVQKRAKEKLIPKGLELLEKVGLADKANSYPSELSGGQKQRVAIARSLAMNPRVLLFDEPTSALDPEMVGEVLKVIQELKSENISMVIVSHEIEFVKNISNRILFFDEGKLVESGTPDKLLSTPKTKRLQDFIQKI